MRSILVTGVGGVVGQGILRNIHAMNIHTPIIGTNTQPVSAGNYLCDYLYQVPYAYEENYVTSIEEIVQKHGIGLIIPSTDYESHYLALHRSSFSCKVASSPPEVTGFCLDKYRNFQIFAESGLPFARTFLPSEYGGEFVSTIVKPREGRGSRDVYVNPLSPKDFTDDYVVQEYLVGPELTIAFYVLQTGDLHGFITMERELEQGNTSRCEVVFQYNNAVREIIQQAVLKFPFRGSCNIQARVTSKGIIPFEINCRISGTNSVRAQLGFNDVAYTVEELFFNRQPPLPQVRKGCAIRVIHDLIYPDISLHEVSDCHDDFRIF